MIDRFTGAQVGDFVLAGSQRDRGLGRVFVVERGGRRDWIARIFRPEAQHRDRDVERAQLKNVQSPFVWSYVYVAGVDEHAEEIFLVRPKMTQTLETWRSLDGKSVREVAVAVLHGLSALHRNRIVHGDLRPSNIGRDDQAEWGVADYGYRPLLGTNATIEAARRDQRFLGPEIDETGPTTASDVYGFGATFVELLLGRPWTSVASALSDLDHAWDFGADFDRDWLTYLNACLSLDPSRRPTVDALLAYAEDERDALVHGITMRLESPVLHRQLSAFVRRMGVPHPGDDDVTQDVLVGALAQLEARPALAVTLSAPRSLERYLHVAARNAVYNLSRRQLYLGRNSGSDPVSVALASSAAEVSSDPIAAWQNAHDAIEEVAEEIGDRATTMLRERMYGTPLTTIAEMLTTADRSVSPYDVFMTLFRLKRAYPELSQVLPDESAAAAGRYLSGWLEGLGLASTADRALVVAELTGSNLDQVALDLGITQKSARQRLRRLEHDDPWIRMLLRLPAASTSDFDRAAAHLSPAAAPQLDELDEPWRKLVQRRAAAVLETATRGESTLGAEEAASLILTDLQRAITARRQLLDLPSMTWDALDHAAIRADVERYTGASSGGVILLPDGPGEFVVPAFQFDRDGRMLQVVARLNRALLSDRDPWGAAGWWVQPNARLPLSVSPMTLLGTSREGELVPLAAALEDPD